MLMFVHISYYLRNLVISHWVLSDLIGVVWSHTTLKWCLDMLFLAGMVLWLCEEYTKDEHLWKCFMWCICSACLIRAAPCLDIQCSWHVFFALLCCCQLQKKTSFTVSSSVVLSLLWALGSGCVQFFAKYSEEWWSRELRDLIKFVRCMLPAEYSYFLSWEKLFSVLCSCSFHNEQWKWVALQPLLLLTVGVFFLLLKCHWFTKRSKHCPIERMQCCCIFSYIFHDFFYDSVNQCKSTLYAV